MMSREGVVAQLLVECEDDHVGLWEVINAVEFDLGVHDPSKLRAASLEIVRSLLDHPGIEAGFPTPDGRHFTPWKMSHNNIIKRIEQEWDALGRLPTIGDIVWFSLEAPNHVTA
jgi:hypothetical protein